MMSATYSTGTLPAFEPLRDWIDKPAQLNEIQLQENGSIPRPLPAKTDLDLFENVSPSYEPSTWWLDGHSPAHPHFDNAGRIQLLAKTIKSPLLQYILEGCGILLEAAGNNVLRSSITRHDALWSAAVSIHKYGVIYLATRSECRDEFSGVVNANPRLFEEINAFLSTNSNGTRAINYGVHRLINCGTLTVDHETCLIPPGAISAIGMMHVAVRAKDFEGDSVCLLGRTDAMWDLHDFAHLTAASLSPEIFGSKYFSHLAKLPRGLTALIRSPKMKTADPTPRCSDGVVFSELLTPLFTAELEAVQRGSKTHTYSSLTDTLSERVADYLMGTCELRHLTTGEMLSVKEPITATQLAVLVQNKFYEMTASEIEQRVLTRGGPAGDEEDELHRLGMAERIGFLARCRRWLYFEVRNTIKHRSHMLAYKKVTERMLADTARCSATDRDLLDCVLGAIQYSGWEKGNVSNLWQIVAERQCCTSSGSLPLS